MATKGKKFNIVDFLTKVGATVAGAAAGKMAEPLLAKLPGGNMVQQAAKIGVGGAAAYFVKNDLVKYAGIGMASQGAYSLVASFVPQLSGWDGVYGIGYAPSALPNYIDEVSGNLPEGSVIGDMSTGEGSVIGAYGDPLYPTDTANAYNVGY
jgi:hypothetical protein